MSRRGSMQAVSEERMSVRVSATWAVPRLARLLPGRRLGPAALSVAPVAVPMRTSIPSRVRPTQVERSP